MKGKLIISLIIIIVLLLLIVLITNVIYNMSEDNFDYSYACCDDRNGTILYEAPCKCKSDRNIIEKTLIVLGIK